MANSNGQLDTAIEIVTPENIAFEYRVAGPFRRLPAYLIDLAIRLGVGLLASIGIGFLTAITELEGVGVGAMFVVWFFLLWFYGGLFEAFWNGQTPGKRLMQIRVLSVDGQPINGLQAMLRNILRAIDMQPIFFYQLGLITASMNDRFQRLGDLACGTMVVVEEPHWFRGLVKIDNIEAMQLAAQIPASFQASRSLARALASYVQRRSYFPLARRLEIARHLGEPLCERFELASDTNLDHLLCGLYHRTFITDRQEDSPNGGSSPFAVEQKPEEAGVATDGGSN